MSNKLSGPKGCIMILLFETKMISQITGYKIITENMVYEGKSDG